MSETRYVVLYDLEHQNQTCGCNKISRYGQNSVVSSKNCSESAFV